jgi:hypothetical protein
LAVNVTCAEVDVREPAADDFFFFPVVIPTVILLVGTVFLFIEWNTAKPGVLKLRDRDRAWVLAVNPFFFTIASLYI